jgi:hypothetical protein
MMFNPVIVIAIIIQGFLTKVSRLAGAIVGYLITTGIFLWGMGLYTKGDQIALFRIPLSQEVFLLACLVWYGFDTKEFLAATKEQKNQGPTVSASSSSPQHILGSTPFVTAICPSCGKTNTGTTTLYHCQYCGQNLRKNK